MKPAVKSPSKAWQEAPVEIRMAVFNWFDHKDLTFDQFHEARAHFWFDSLMGCWFFTACNMVLGVEKDGHIHS